jgi:outer membrane protein OmpA-like peptidoglycan-associated protein
MAEGRTPLLLALGLLSILSALTLWSISVPADALRAREEARRQVTAALAEEDRPERATELFRQARAFDESYAACEEGARLEARGLFSEAARSFEACLKGDPGLAPAHVAWAEALLRGQGRPAYEEVRSRLRRFVATARQDGSADSATLNAAEELILDLDGLLAEDAPEPRAWTADEIVEILTRPKIRGTSRYDGPRTPLLIRFRPGDADLGSADEEYLREVVAKALRDGSLVGVVIQIEGYTDSTEETSEAGRRELARRRAEAVRDFLIQRCGIPRDQLRVVGLGANYPLKPKSTAEDQAANRRVELYNLESKTALLRDARMPE